MPATVAPPKKILIVEDDKALNASLQRRFRSTGFEATGCFDGQQGMDLLNQGKYDVLLLDLQMPVKDGFAVLAKKGTTANADTPAYVLTGLDQAEKLELARELGAKAVYQKMDMSPAQVAEAIRKEVVAP